MSKLHAIIRVFTLIAFITASLPFQMLEDTHYDGSIDLQDVISAVRQFEASAITPETFINTIRTAVSTLEVAADLKTVIKSDQSTGVQVASFSLTPVIVPRTLDFYTIPTLRFDGSWISTSYLSADQFPPTPPPKLA